MVRVGGMLQQVEMSLRRREASLAEREKAEDVLAQKNLRQGREWAATMDFRSHKFVASSSVCGRFSVGSLWVSVGKHFVMSVAVGFVGG
jgi:hypothetical protein